MTDATAPVPTPDQPAEPLKAGPSKARKITVGIVFGFFGLIIAIVAIVSIAKGPSDDQKASVAVDACRDAVTARLKAPATAEWPGDERRTEHENGNWTITGSVDSENGFGALLRATWVCKYDPTGDGSVTSVDVIEN